MVARNLHIHRTVDRCHNGTTESQEVRVTKTTVDLPETLHRTLRVKAALENRSMNEIVVAAVKGYLHNFRLEPGMLEVETVNRSLGAEQLRTTEV